jgi:DMSO/TMAO reductase YedYZ molybdopterin-dependent catalytic subunit
MKYLRLSTLAAVAMVCFSVTLSAQDASAPAQTPALSIAVTGDVPTPITVTAADMAAMPRQTAQIAEEDGQKVTYEGVALQDILAKAGVKFGHDMRGKALAGYVLAEAHDGYAVVFSMGELDDAFGATKILIADKRDGRPLFGYQGPARLVIPADKAGARSVRMLEKIEVVKLRK